MLNGWTWPEYEPPNLDPLCVIATLDATRMPKRILKRVRVNARMHQKLLDTCTIVNKTAADPGAMLMYRGVPLVCDLPDAHPSGIKMEYTC